MKHLNTILSVILALPFVLFGPSHFLHYMPVPPMEGDSAVFAGLLAGGYMTSIKIMEIVFGFMIMFNYQRPLALLLIAPIVLNILFFEVFISHMPGIGVIITILNTVLIYRYRAYYQGIIVRKTSESQEFSASKA